LLTARLREAAAEKFQVAGDGEDRAPTLENIDAARDALITVLETPAETDVDLLAQDWGSGNQQPSWMPGADCEALCSLRLGGQQQR